MHKELRAQSATLESQLQQLRIYVLGPLRIERNDISISLPRRKVESLLAYLLLHPEPHTRDSLATRFWGDTNDEKARHSLRTALTTVRQHLGETLLIASREQVQINPDFPLWIDLHELLSFDKEISAIGLAQPGALDSLLNLWRGDLLEGVYEDWLTTEREYYRIRVIKLFLKITHALRSQSEYARSILVTERILQMDRAIEAAHQHLMFCYIANGNRVLALQQYERCERALLEDLDVPPSSETTALYRWIKQQEGGESATAAKITNLPIPLTSFIGRIQSMCEVKLLLNPQGNRSRLLTLTGAGGSGKTRLSIQVATDLIDSFADGVWWVELAALNEGEKVARALAKSLGVIEVSYEPCLQSVGNFVADKHLLLVLDNCEHLIDAAAEAASELLRHCPNLQILATSRESLNLPGEIVWQVPTLTVPEAQQVSLLDILLQYECIRLFYERASAVQPNFKLTIENSAAVVKLCSQLDGIPLAIELAAARVKVLPVEQISARLSSTIGARFDLLNHGSRTMEPRQQTLRAAIDWSYHLLDEDERRLFRTIAVFRGGFTLEALEKILDFRFSILEGGTASSKIQNPLDLLTQLVDKSLVIVEQQGRENRYRMLETLREYALERFVNPLEWQEVQHCHAQYFVDWAEQIAPQLIAAQQQEWFSRLEWEHSNLRAALEWLIANRRFERALRLAVALFRFWEIRGYVNEGRSWFKRLLAEEDSVTPELRARAYNDAGFLAFRQSDFDEAKSLFETSLHLFFAAENEEGTVEVWQNLAIGEIRQGRFASAEHYLRQSLETSLRLPYDFGVARAFQHFAIMAYDQDNMVEARNYAAQSLTRFHALGDQVSIANLHLNLANALNALGEVEAARQNLEACLKISRNIGHKGVTGAALRSLGRILMHLGELAQAKKCAEESLHIFQQLGDKSHIGFALVLLGDISHRQHDEKLSMHQYAQAVQLFVAHHYKWPIYDTLECIAEVLVEIDQLPEVSVRFFGAADAIRREIGNRVTEAEEKGHNYCISTLRSQLGGETFEQLWQEGQTQPLAQIVSDALQLPSLIT